MPAIYIYPYSSGSESAKLLANRLGAKRIRLTNSTYQYSPDHLVINWGNTNCPYPCLNMSDMLRQTVDKLRFFRLCTQADFDEIPRYWTNRQDIPSGAFPIFCRTTTTGCDGDGTVVANNRDELVDAPLYTSAIKGGTEYRVTVFRGEGVTDIQTKKPRAGHNPTTLIKTYANGYGFQRLPVDLAVADAIGRLADRVLAVTKLDFCGIDVIHRDGLFYVLEVNSAMGLEGQALEKFAQAVESFVQKHYTSVPAPSTQTLPELAEEAPEAILEAIRDKRWTDVIRYAALQMAA